MDVEDCLTQTIYDLFTVEGAVCAPVGLSKEARSLALSCGTQIVSQATEDLLAFVERDPSLMGEPSYALVSNGPFMATLCYRIAHYAWVNSPRIDARRNALAISHFGRVLTGAEIHPAAEVGRRFILDHGTNTVIGATCEIGDDCYVLNGVVLGARGIAGNAPTKRHPTIGDRVEIGSFARVLGDIHVGDDVFICPHSVITQDVPSGGEFRRVVKNGPVNLTIHEGRRGDLRNAV
ncbi:serine O-acetyltransferase [Paracoccaceae bacterium GXU_MW_L88]